MEMNFYLFLGQCIIFLNQYTSIVGKAIIGHNIREAQQNEYTYVVSIMQVTPGHPYSGGDHFCTGVLITRQDVLTVAHCLEDETLNETQLVLETIDLRNGRVFFPFWWKTHDQWARANNLTIDFDRNDVANIRLLREVSENILPIRLSRLSNTELYNAEVVIAGWGINNQGVVPPIMNIAKLKVIENNVCETRLARVMGPTRSINVRLLCTFASPYTLIEFGDSGGPLIFRHRLIGLNKSTCPGSTIGTNEVQMNLHMCIYFYSLFINYIKES